MRIGLERRLARAACLLLAAAALAGCGLFETPPPEEPGPAWTAQQVRSYAQAESLLRSPDPETRLQAAVALLSMDYPPALSSALKSMREAEDPAVRVSLIKAAGFRADDRCFEAVLEAVRDPEPAVRQAAGEALSKFTTPEQVDAMVGLVRDRGTTAAQRRLIFQALGGGVAVRAVPVLLAGLEHEDPETRTAAYSALRRISGRQLPMDPAQWRAWYETAANLSREELLEQHLAATEHQLAERSSELSELENQQRELMRLVRSAESETPQMLVEALSSRYAPVRQYGSARLAALDRSALNGLQLDREHYATLRAALADQSDLVRRNTARFVAMMDSERRDELVLLALRDEDPQVLTTAIEAVRTGTGQKAVERLGELLAQSPHARVREAAANALGKVGTEQQTAVLMAALSDPEQNVRWFAVEGLRKLGATGAVPQISALLAEDPSARVREIAASSLGELAMPAAVPALREALDDESERVRHKAVAALLALATDDYQRMMVIAASLKEHGLLDAAEGVLTRAVQTVGQGTGLAGQAAEAHRRLGDVRMAAGRYQAAATAYARHEELTGGSPEVRKLLVTCWVRGGEAARVADAVAGWLAGAGVKDELLGLALDSVEALIEAGEQDEAAAVLQLVAENAAQGGSAAVINRIEELRARLGE